MAKIESIILALSLVLMIGLLSFNVVGGYGTLLGGKTEINDVKTNKEVQQLGKFSVEEFNQSHRRSGSKKLVFSQVVEAQKQVVSGINYFLKIEATQNGVTRTFDSVVFVKPWIHSKQLVTFAPSEHQD